MPATADSVESTVRAWLESFVVGLNLCPFARPLLGADNLRIVSCEQTEAAALQRAFLEELDRLQASSEAAIATTLLAFPQALTGFEEYLDFLDECQQLLVESGLEGVLQLASFHPRYRFEGEDEAGSSHYSNRAPYPIIHFLRESMLTRVLADYPDPEAIPGNNIATLSAIGVTELKRRWQALF
jgi:uncharacterized protein